MATSERKDLEDKKNPVPQPITRRAPKLNFSIPNESFNQESEPRNLILVSEESNNSNTTNTSDLSTSSTFNKSARYGKNVWSLN